MASMSACIFLHPPKSHSLTLSRRPFNLSHFNYATYPAPPVLPAPGKYRCRKSFFAVIRASCSSVDVTEPEISLGGAVESDKLPSNVRNRTMGAIDSSGRRVTMGDVASKAGLKLNEAQRALQALAADTSGFLEVSDEGDILYVFPKDYRSKLASKSFVLKIEPLLEKGKMAAEYLVRVSFGTALIASIVLVYTAIIAIVSSSRESDERGRRGRSYNHGFTFYLSPTDLFWYWDPYYYRSHRVRKDGGLNFIESVFSFVFGDGDPNQGIEEERWKLIGQYIASSGGIVTAEELAPYLDVENAERKDDDSYILPVLLRFDGQPEIDEEGNILYRFPSLQRTAALQRSGQKEYVGRKWAGLDGGIQKFFKENKLKFSKTSASERAMVIGLGGLNLFGILILGSMLKAMTISPSGFLSFVSEIYPLLQIYAGSFFAIPLLRWCFVQSQNGKIMRRNHAREQFARALASPDLSLRRKISSARGMAQRTFIDQDRIVYSSEKDLYEQDIEAHEWDSKFKQIEKFE